MLETRLSPEQQRVVGIVQDVARAHEMNIYLSGGAVRDLTSGFPIRDLDFSVQGNALKLQKDLEKAGMVLDGLDADARVLYMAGPTGVRMEVASTRSETFPKPGKPQYGPANMLEDLRRRDFTVNAMALSLNPGSRGLLMDPFNGVADIEAKVLRVLHNYSFLEDPSRLVRAIRFATRFQWALEEKTQLRYESAKEGDYISALNHDSIGYELEEIGHEENPLQIIKALEKEGWMQHLYPSWTSAKADVSGLHDVAKTRQQMNELGLMPDPSAANLYFLTAKLPEKDVNAIQKQMPRQAFVKEWRGLEHAAKDLMKQLLSKEAATPSQTWSLLMTSKPETMLFLDVTAKNQTAANKLKNFLTKWPLVRQKLPYQTMAELRITPELPIYKGLLNEMFLLMLDGKLRSQTEIMKFLEPHSPPLPPPPQPIRRGRVAKKAEAKKAPAEKAAAHATAAHPAAATPEAAAKAGKKQEKLAKAEKPKETKAPAVPEKPQHPAPEKEKAKAAGKAKAEPKHEPKKAEKKKHAAPAAKSKPAKKEHKHKDKKKHHGSKDKKKKKK